MLRGVLPPCLLVLGLLAMASAPAGKPPADKARLDCSECHTCEHPSKAQPCLESICPRHEASQALSADIGPSVVVLDQLVNLYVPVVFNHKGHAEMTRFSGGCETCHHFTPPDEPHPTCRDCHPAEISHEDIAQPGLKGAYHRNCMSCHREWDKDTACEICHEKASGGPPTVHQERHYAPVEIEELILFPTSYEGGEQVPFHHRNHSVLYERDCTECHQEQSCTRCHVHGASLHPMGDLADVNLHDVCFDCHKEEPCGDCHGRDPEDLFSHAETGWPLASFHRNLTCRGCHGDQGAFQKPDPVCSSCHEADQVPRGFVHTEVGVELDEVHGDLECGDCHPGGFGSAADCETCHDDGRRYEKARGFTTG